MRFLVSALVLGFTVAAVSAGPRIVGGKDAPDGKYPYQVSLRHGNSHFCGGSILNKRWILTAAHCVVNEPNDSINVVVGTNSLIDGKGEVYKSEYVNWHEGYKSYFNDVGIIRVNRDIEFNEKVQSIPLPDEDFAKVDYPAVLTGWGSTRAGSALPKTLQEIDLKVISLEKCDEEMTPPISKVHICTLTKAGEGACHGDSGGPLVSDGVQIGIVSFGRPCAVGKPDVFARVYTFLPWIKKEMKKPLPIHWHVASSQ